MCIQTENQADESILECYCTKTLQTVLSPRFPPSVTVGQFPPILKGGKDVKNKSTSTSFIKLVAESRTIKITAPQREVRAESGHWAGLQHVLPANWGCAASASHTQGRFIAEGRRQLGIKKQMTKDPQTPKPLKTRFICSATLIPLHRSCSYFNI